MQNIFLIKTYNKNYKISAEFTQEEALLQQYFAIREKVYVEAFNLTDFSTHYDDYDYQDYTHILVIRNGGRVIGGARLTIHHKGTSVKLPMEGEGFLLSDIFPQLMLEDKTYAEVTRLAIMPEFRGYRTIATNVLGLLFTKAVSRNADYMLSVAPAVQSRNNRRHFTQLGYKTETCHDIQIPNKEAYEGKKMYLSINNIKNIMPIMTQEPAEELATVLA